MGQVMGGDKVLSLPSYKTAFTDDDTQMRETRTQRVQRLQREAHELAEEQVAEFEDLLSATIASAREIAEGGDAYGVGAREICRRLAEDLSSTIQTLHVISKKNKRLA